MAVLSAPRRRQFGSERSTTPRSTVHDRPTDGMVIRGRAAIVLTVVFWVSYVVDTIIREFLNRPVVDFRFASEAISYLVIVTVLVFSALMYLIARQGALQRFRDHQRVPRAALDNHFDADHGSMTVLVPSYSEEPSVVRATLWSAALQEYPSLKIVLLLDDPPFPTDPAIAAQLEQSRAITGEIMHTLGEPRERATEGLAQFERDFAAAATGIVTVDAVRSLASQYHWSARWLQKQAYSSGPLDHVETFFVSEVVGGLAMELADFADALDAAAWEKMAPTPQRMIQLHRRLIWIFTAELETFERKKFTSLSHDANKAMNLNAYIGLMGRHFRLESPRHQTTQRQDAHPHDAQRPDAAAGGVLWPVATEAESNYSVPDSQYLLTLDADSLLLRDYCLRLVYFLEQSENAKVAVTQTPYSSFRGAPTRIERLAGATTDIQHILHQGMSHYGAAFWVGANAVIRKRALEDIVEVETVGGFEVRRYVQDRTVIEDTESSIDLGSHGWTLVNYPERLSYSATPPDFGSLIVQRRRWANGGLLILPKLIRQVIERKRRGEPMSILEFCLRLNYTASIAWASFGLVFLLAYPYDSHLLSPIVLLASLPYFLAMASDLRYNGYRFTDIFRIYGFNLILLPVNLAGVLKSLQQAMTGKKIPFARTPKVKNRTAAPLVFVVVPYLIVAFSLLTLWRDIHAENWGNAIFAGFNALLAFFSIVANIGLWHSLVDVWLGLTDWMWVETKQPSPVTETVVHPLRAELDWRSVLYHGQQSPGRALEKPRTNTQTKSKLGVGA